MLLLHRKFSQTLAGRAEIGLRSWKFSRTNSPRLGTATRALQIFGQRSMLWLLCVLLLFQYATASASDQSSHKDLTKDIRDVSVNGELAPALIARAQTTSLPRPFDSALSNNYTATCDAFFEKFLSDPDFISCVPLSLLLQTSTSFYQVTKSFVLVTQTLDAACSANFSSCQAIMNSYAEELISTACPMDYNNRNQNVLQAYNGFLAYPSLYYAGCLRSGQMGSPYCFANSVTNQSDPTASYIYYLPLGTLLPSGTRPSCNGCLKNTFSVYANYAGNTSLPLSRTYSQATQEIDVACGPNFVKMSVVAVAPNIGIRGFSFPGFSTLAIATFLAIVLLL